MIYMAILKSKIIHSKCNSGHEGNTYCCGFLKNQYSLFMINAIFHLPSKGE